MKGECQVSFLSVSKQFAKRLVNFLSTFSNKELASVVEAHGVDSHVRTRFELVKKTGSACKIPVDLHKVVPFH